MSSMFYGCTNLKSIYADKSKFVIPSNRGNMFADAGTNVFINKSDNVLFGYEIKGDGDWTENPVKLRPNGWRAYVHEILHLDLNKKYIIKNNTNKYYMQIISMDKDNKRTSFNPGVEDYKNISEWKIENEEYIVFNFRYPANGSSKFDNNMVQEIINGIEIKIIE